MRRSLHLALELALAFALPAIVCLLPQHRLAIPLDTQNPLVAFPRNQSSFPYPFVLTFGVLAGTATLAALALHHHSFPLLVHGVVTLLFSVGLTKATTDALKRLVGRPRPNCLALIAEGPSDNAFRSFPSGHASTAFCTMLFVALLLWDSVSRSSRSLVRLLLCALPLCLAGWVAGSRIAEYHHHTDDVLTGALLGCAIAAACYFTRFSKWIPPQHQPQPDTVFDL